MVAVKAHEAERILRNLSPSWRVILLYGPDSGLVSERAGLLARAGVDDPGDPFQLVRIDGDALASDPVRLSDEAGTIGLFGSRRVLWISPTTRGLLSAVEPLLANPPEDALVIIEAGELQRSNPLRVACERAGGALAIPCYGDTGKDLGEVIDAAMQAAGKRLSRPVRDLLASSLGSDRMVSRRELEKLVLYVGEQPEITAADVTATVGDNAAREIDMLVDAVFAGQMPILDRTLSRLEREGTDGNAVLASLLRHALGLLKARMAYDEGKSLREAGLLIRGLPYPRMAAVETCIKVWSANQLQEVVTIAGQASAQLRADSQMGPYIVKRALWTICRMQAKARR